MLSHRPYLGYALAFALTFGALFSYVSGSPFVYQNVLGLTANGTAAAFAVSAGLTTVSSMASAKLVGRIPPARLLHAGLGAMVVATVLLCCVAATVGLGLAVALTLFAVHFLGVGLVVPNATSLALQQVPHDKGAGSAVLGALQSALSAAVAPLIGLAGAHTAAPMIAGMTVCVGLAVLTIWFTRG